MSEIETGEFIVIPSIVLYFALNEIFSDLLLYEKIKKVVNSINKNKKPIRISLIFDI